MLDAFPHERMATSSATREQWAKQEANTLLTDAAITAPSRALGTGAAFTTYFPGATFTSVTARWSGRY
jgi:hypothetical protein